MDTGHDKANITWPDTEKHATNFNRCYQIAASCFREHRKGLKQRLTIWVIWGFWLCKETILFLELNKIDY